ncbi:MAG: nuclear transport factor 2 family protein [Acidobacteriaceae bacterium]|nr:nuclear transport factor 2 family protein [Acidobacteriaceae bacterium]
MLNRLLPALVLTLTLTPNGHAQSSGATSSAFTAQDEAAIRHSLIQSSEDWNQGNMDAFLHCYKDSPDILFIGPKVQHGYAQMSASYKKHYATSAQMGKLSFTDLEVQALDAHFATATGWFHLVRDQKDGGNGEGYFLLVLEKTEQGWKIVRDDTTSAAASH